MQGLLVIVPQMPKGVEHRARERDMQVALQVIVPQMPKGVEHFPTVRSKSIAE